MRKSYKRGTAGTLSWQLEVDIAVKDMAGCKSRMLGQSRAGALLGTRDFPHDEHSFGTAMFSILFSIRIGSPEKIPNAQSVCTHWTLPELE
jgi:hypothetical protein